MSTMLRQQRKASLPQTSFGPLRLLPALPWLILAAAMRVIAFGGGAVAFPAIVVATVAVLHAFLVTAQHAIEASGGQTGLGELDLTEQLRLSLSILWRVVLLMLAAELALYAVGYASLAPHMMAGLDGMAFDQFTTPGKFWSATIAALVLLMVVHAEKNGGDVAFFVAVTEFGRRGLWLGTAVIVLGAVYLVLGFGQDVVRSAIWHFWQTSASSPFIKNLVYFVFIFGFAMLRLWITLLILTYGLKQSYIHGD
jgi:hypothetical protein